EYLTSYLSSWSTCFWAVPVELSTTVRVLLSYEYTFMKSSIVSLTGLMYSMWISSPTLSVLIARVHSWLFFGCLPTSSGSSLACPSTDIIIFGNSWKVSVFVAFRHTSIGRGGGRKLGTTTRAMSMAPPIAIGGISISFLPSLLLGFSSFILRFGNCLWYEKPKALILLCVRSC